MDSDYWLGFYRIISLAPDYNNEFVKKHVFGDYGVVIDMNRCNKHKSAWEIA